MPNDDAFRAEAQRLLTAFRGTHDLDSLLKSLIPVQDSFDRLLSASGTSGASGSGSAPLDPTALLSTCARIARQLESAVAAAGLISFGAPGEVLDLDRHMVIGVTRPDGAAEDTVVEVVRRGYEKDGRVIRPAEVIVAGQPPEEPAV